MTAPAKPGTAVAIAGEQTYRDPHEVMIERLAKPEDLTAALDAYDRNRKVLMKFISTHLQESAYEERDGLKLPKAGEMNDYYLVPGSTTKALTKLGAEKLGQLFRFRRGDTQVTHQVATKELCEVRVRVTLVDQYQRPGGSFESACTTQERSFQSVKAKKKYADDYRAALNDVIARASKRAFVQAVIYSTATDEIFQAAADPEEQRAEAEDPPPPPRPEGPRLPKGKFGQHGGKLIAEVPTPDLEKIYVFCRGAKNPKSWAPIADAVADELDSRRLDEDDDDLPL